MSEMTQESLKFPLPLGYGQPGVAPPFGRAYNLGDFLHRLGLPKAVRDLSLCSLQVKLIKMEG